MLWRASLRRLPILILAYAFALQVIVAGWSGAVHGPGAVANALLDALCRSPLVASSDGGLSSPVPSSDHPSHDCALACLGVQGGAFDVARAGAPAIRHASVLAALTADGAAFRHPAVAFAAFAARAPPQPI